MANWRTDTKEGYDGSWRIISVHRSDNIQAICMPYFGRTTLAEALQDDSQDDGRWCLTRRLAGCWKRVDAAWRSDETECCRIAAKIAAGLAHAHQRGIIHRDLKPANKLLADNGDPMIVDFNLSDDVVVGGRLSLMVGGTLPYMAPEHLEAVLRGQGPNS
jgi:serine/threonine protein kinase